MALTGRSVAVPGAGATAWHAARLLEFLGASAKYPAACGGAAADWAASGAMALTGRRDGPPLLPPGQAASATGGALRALELLSGVPMPDARVLSERAAITGFTRDAPSSAGGAFRILRAADGWLGVNLARESDVELLPAWLESPLPLDEAIARRGAAELAERARLLGLPAAAWSIVDAKPFVLTGSPGTPGKPGLVVDFSSLWAGPLCGHLLTLAGARVVKVESVRRPDGARYGAAAFFDLLHAGQESVAVDFGTTQGKAQLAGLVEAADVVIEASRPRALRQLGIVAEDVLARARDKCWVSITAYGRTGPWSNAVGFGDDAALAGGLMAVDADGTPAPCGDAIADPVTGVHAALAAYACRLAGGTWLVDVSLRDVIASTMIPAPPEDPGEVADPWARPPQGLARELGADTASVLTGLGLPC